MSDIGEQYAHRWRLLSRSQRVDENVQCQQHKAEADGNAAKRTRKTLAANAESDEPDNESTGAAAEILKERTCTISVVPTFAPSMIASAGTRLQNS